MARAKPYCADCVQDPTLTAGPQGLCQQVYDEMDRCMKAHRGNVADCVPEWNAFRDCHQLSTQRRQREREQQHQKQKEASAPMTGSYVAGKR